MMLGGPQHVKAEFIHELCDVARGIESFSQALVRIAPVIRRRALQTNVFEFDLTNVQDVKFADHAGPRRSGDRVTVTLKDVLQLSLLAAAAIQSLKWRIAKEFRRSAEKRVLSPVAVRRR